MPTVNPTITFVGNDAVLFSWTLTNVDNDGAPVGPNHADYADRTVAARGTFGGASVAIQGSNQPDVPSVWFVIDDPQGLDLTLAAAGGKALTELPMWSRPLLSGGAGSSVTIEMLCRRNRG